MWLALFLGLLHMVSSQPDNSHVGSETLPHEVGPNEEIRDLSGGDCNAPI